MLLVIIAVIALLAVTPGIALADSTGPWALPLMLVTESLMAAGLMAPTDTTTNMGSGSVCLSGC